MTFIHHKNKIERFCPATGETLTITSKKGIINVTSNKESIYEEKWSKNN